MERVTNKSILIFILKRRLLKCQIYALFHVWDILDTFHNLFVEGGPGKFTHNNSHKMKAYVSIEYVYAWSLLLDNI